MSLEAQAIRTLLHSGRVSTAAQVFGTGASGGLQTGEMACSSTPGLAIGMDGADVGEAAATREWMSLLCAGATHEWLCESMWPCEQQVAPPQAMQKDMQGVGWGGVVGADVPLSLLMSLALGVGTEGAVVWVGRRVWPAPASLPRALAQRSLLVEVDETATRVWAIEQALRTPGVSAVVGDARGLSTAQSRRLQLAAEAGRTVGLLSRSVSERRQLSAAGTRWMVAPVPSETGLPRWGVELLRCKVAARTLGQGRRWVLERMWTGHNGASHGSLLVRVVPGLVGGSGAGDDAPCGWSSHRGESRAGIGRRGVG